MGRVYIFADEAGNFDFSRKRDASKYFVLTTITATTCAAGDALSVLRRDLSWEGYDLPDGFHAMHDPKPRKMRVYAALELADFRIDATIIEKSKAMPKIRTSETRFYKYAWWLHLKCLASKVVRPSDELHVVAASIATRARRSAFHDAVQDVVHQVSPTTTFKVSSWSSATDPNLQAADYACWAIGRKWEHGDASYHGLIAGKIRSEFDVFRLGGVHYY